MTWDEPPVEPDEPDELELGVLDGDRSEPDEPDELDEVEPDVAPPDPEDPDPEDPDPEDTACVAWPELAQAAVAERVPVRATPAASAHRLSRETRRRPAVRALIASSPMG